MIQLREKGLPYRKIGENMAPSHSKDQVKRVIDHYAAYGSPPEYRQHKRPKHSKKRRLGEHDKQVLGELFDEVPSLYLDEATNILNVMVGYNFTEKAIWTALQDMGLTWKEVSCSVFVLVTASGPPSRPLT